MYACLAMASVHMRFLRKCTQPTQRELLYCQRTTTTFNKAIAGPIASPDKDAVFGTAILLNSLAFADISTTSPQDSWPMVSSEDSLRWISIQKGVYLLAPSTQPWRPESIYAEIVRDHDNEVEENSDQRPGTDGLPLRLCDLYDIDASSTVENNPYHSAVRYLAPLLRLDGCLTDKSKYIRFIEDLRPEFVALLRKREHRAVLLLSFFYALILPLGQWDWNPRAKAECQAICMFLERESKDPRIRSLLGFSAKACGYELEKPIPASEGLPMNHLVPCNMM